MKTQRGDGMFGLAFGTTRMAELSALRASHTLALSKFLGTHFCVDPGLLYVESRNKSLENFQESYKQTEDKCSSRSVMWTFYVGSGGCFEDNQAKSKL
jgi:hypothetical protein